MSNARNLANLLGTGTQITTADIADGAFQANRNLIINGAMQVAQRGTSFSATGTIYTVDRWEVFTGNSNCTTTQEEFTVGQTDVPHNPTHYINVAKNGETQACQVRQKIEDVRILSGETVTLSFWANTSSTLALDIFQNFGTGGSTQQQRLSGGSFTIVETNGSWSKYQITNTQSNVSGKTIGAGSYTLFRIVETTATTNDVAVTQVQLEVGDTATPFEHRSYGDELARCQRYYQKLWFRSYNIFTDYTGNQYATQSLVNPIRADATVTNSGSTGANITITLMKTVYDTALEIQCSSSGTHNNWVTADIYVDAEL